VVSFAWRPHPQALSQAFASFFLQFVTACYTRFAAQTARVDNASVSLCVDDRRDRCDYCATPNANTVFDSYVCPGRSIVDGKFDLFGESGKCCVSRQNPVRRP